jgi:hypothetical protein
MRYTIHTLILLALKLMFTLILFLRDDVRAPPATPNLNQGGRGFQTPNSKTRIGCFREQN